MRSKTGDHRDTIAMLRLTGRAGRQREEQVAGRWCPRVKELSLRSYQELDSTLGYTFWRGPSRWASGDGELNCGREKDTRLHSPCSLSPRGHAKQGCSQQSSSGKQASGEGGDRRVQSWRPGQLGVTGPAGRLKTLGELRSKAVCWQNFCFFEGP